MGYEEDKKLLEEKRREVYEQYIEPLNKAIKNLENKYKEEVETNVKQIDKTTVDYTALRKKYYKTDDEKAKEVTEPVNDGELEGKV